MYETESDRSREAAIFKEVRRVWGCQGFKRPMKLGTTPKGHIDFLLDWGFCKRLAEIKERFNPLNQYPTYFISELKLIAAKPDPDAVMIIKFADGIKWCYFKEPHEIHVGGRRDRGDPHDIERMVHYPVGLFKPLEAGPP